MQKGQRGVLIKKVLPTGPAAGVLADGDALLSFGGVQVRINQGLGKRPRAGLAACPAAPFCDRMVRCGLQLRPAGLP